MQITYQQAKNFKNIDSPNGRVYEVPLGKYPSVTTVLGKTSNNTYLQIWKEKVGEQEAARISKSAADRGSLVHKYLDDYAEQYKDFSDFNNFNTFLYSSNLHKEQFLHRNLVKQMIYTLSKAKFVNIASEFVVWDDDLKIAGRCDSIGIYNNKLTIVDFKTSTKKKSLNSDAIKNYRLQATAYCKAHNMLFPNKVNNFCILIVTDNLEVQTIEGNSINFIPELRYRVRRFYEQQ